MKQKIDIKPTTETEKRLPWAKCLCGGKYVLYNDDQNRPVLAHSLPWCKRYETIDDTEQAVKFSQVNRGVS
jgi:hypothetical protein